jgi:hypothetical protein
MSAFENDWLQASRTWLGPPQNEMLDAQHRVLSSFGQLLSRWASEAQQLCHASCSSSHSTLLTTLHQEELHAAVDQLLDFPEWERVKSSAGAWAMIADLQLLRHTCAVLGSPSPHSPP